jgi:hypothetical protein
MSHDARSLSRTLLSSVLAALLGGLLSVSAAADGSESSGEPVRSGTILNAANQTGPASCELWPDCQAWRVSHCDPNLAGINPAAFTSIVDVRSLRGSDRHITISGPTGGWLDDSLVAFWSAGCTRISVTLVSVDADLRVPPKAAWMVVPSSTGPIRWTLR